MNRRALNLVLIGLALCLGAYLFTHNYAIVKDRVWVGMSGEARVNPLLAARMLLTRMGARVQESTDLARLEKFPADGTLFLAAERGELDPPTAQRLLSWVEAGGHLVVGVERPFEHDALLTRLGISADADSSLAKASDVELPDGTHLRVDLEPSPSLHDSESAASWSYASHGAIRMLQIPYENGLITVLSTFRPFGNSAIGRLDHAELFWRLASVDGQPPLDVWLVRHLDVQSLPRWLVAHALPALFASSVFLVLALWRVMLRFGPLQPNPVPDRRSLVEHLSAMGRFYSMERLLLRLIQIVRQDGTDLLAARAPETRGQDGTARLKAAARLTGLRPRELLHAFTGSVSTPHDFTSAMRVLAAFRRQLSSSTIQESRRRMQAGGERRRDHRMRAEFDKAFREAREAQREQA